MTDAQAAKQAKEYRAAADDYAAKGDTFVADSLRELADRIDAKLAQRRATA